MDSNIVFSDSLSEDNNQNFDCCDDVDPVSENSMQAMEN
jgi:hypothetical protein